MGGGDMGMGGPMGGFGGPMGGPGGFGGPMGGPGMGMERKQQNDSLLKTKLCVSFQRTGVCSFNERCRFAHGEHELRQPGEAAAMVQQPPMNVAPEAMAPTVLTTNTVSNSVKSQGMSSGIVGTSHTTCSTCASNGSGAWTSAAACRR